MGASESKTDGIDVDVADAPVDKTPTPTGSTLSEVDDAKPATPQAVYRTADAPAQDPLAVYGTADGAEEKTTPPAGKTPAKDNLGHPRPPRTDSTLYADKVGKEFASKQPEHEVTAADATELGALGVAPGVGPVYH